MKSFNMYFISLTTVLLSILFMANAFAADNDYQITIINHFDQPLQFTVGINPKTLPDLPEGFTLTPNSDIKTRVLPQKEAYIRVKGENNDHAFFGVDIEKDTVTVHGYLSHGIAYSWTREAVTFCTPVEYKKKHSC